MAETFIDSSPNHSKDSQKSSEGTTSNSYDSSSPTQSSDDCQESSENGTTNERRIKRREKNREAAQRSRQKQTAKADHLHKEYEHLEKLNRGLVEEVKALKENVAYWEKVCRDHEVKCLLCSPDHEELDSLLNTAPFFNLTELPFDLSDLLC